MVTFCLTSCGRPDLLEITLDSFFEHNTYPIKEFMIYEDSGDFWINRELQKKYKGHSITWITGANREGQINALDRMFSKVSTPYIFHCEDDWRFLKGGFVEKSLSILENHSDILQVRLCKLVKHDKHPIDYSRGFGVLKSATLWSGTNFNPSLKRKSDYDLIAPFSQHTTFQYHRPWKSEATISQIYHKMGFKAAILDEDYITHIGEGRHVS